MEIEAILKIVGLAIQYGVPAVAEALAKIRSSAGREPTLEEIAGLLEGVEPPEAFSEAT